MDLGDLLTFRSEIDGRSRQLLEVYLDQRFSPLSALVRPQRRQLTRPGD